MSNIPRGLLDAIERRELILFVGAGVSASAGLPTGQSLAKALNDLLDVSRRIEEQRDQLQLVAERFEADYDRVRLALELEARLSSKELSDIGHAHFLIANLIKKDYVRTLITTNYDRLIEDACRSLGIAIRTIVTSDQIGFFDDNKPTLIKLHGDFAYPDYLVITRGDYSHFPNDPKRTALIDQVKTLIERKYVLYIGYSVNDYNVTTMLDSIKVGLGNKSRRKSYATVLTNGGLVEDDQSWRDLNISAVGIQDASDFVEDIVQELNISPLRVAHLVFAYSAADKTMRYGGIERYLETIKKYSVHNHEVLSVFDDWRTAYGAVFTSDRPLAETPNTYPLVYPSSYFFLRSAVSAAVHKLRTCPPDKRPDIIHTHFLAFAAEIQDAGIPTLCTSHSLLWKDLAYARGVYDKQESPAAKYELKELITAEKNACNELNAIVVLSKSHEDELASLGARNVLKLPVPFDPTPFLDIGTNASEYRARLRLPDKRTVAYFGRPDRRKGLEILIEAYRRLLQQGISAQLLIVGGLFAPESQVLSFYEKRFQIDISGCSDNGGEILYKTPGSDLVALKDLYGASDVVVVPSIYEPLGYVVLEAMAAGRPVVGSCVGGIKELIDDNQTGILFEVGNADDLTGKLVSLLADQDLLRRIGLTSRQNVIAQYNVKAAVGDLDMRYTQIAFGLELRPSERGSSKGFQEKEVEEIFVELRSKDDIDLIQALKGGCDIYRRLSGLDRKDPRPTASPPAIDTDLYYNIAKRIYSIMRKRAIPVVPVKKLAHMMEDFTLAELYKEAPSEPIRLSANDTKNLVQSTPELLDDIL